MMPGLACRKRALVVCFGASVTNVVVWPDRLAAWPSCTPLAPTTETPGYPWSVQVTVLVFSNTRGMISDPAAPPAWPTETESWLEVHGAEPAVVVEEPVVGFVVEEEVVELVEGFVVLLEFGGFVVLMDVVGLLLHPAAMTPARTTAHPICGQFREIIEPPRAACPGVSGSVWSPA